VGARGEGLYFSDVHEAHALTKPGDRPAGARQGGIKEHRRAADGTLECIPV